jgi:acyl-CoA thioesterase FadM
MLLRLTGVVARGLRAPRLSLLDESRIRLRVWPNDLDSNLHMNNSRYLLAMDVGRWDLVLRSGMLGLLWRRRWWPVVGAASLRFRRSLDPFERYTLATRVVAWDQKWTVLEQRFLVGEKTHALGRVKALFRGPQGNVATAELLAAAGRPDVPPRQMPEPIRLWLEAEAAERPAG